VSSSSPHEFLGIGVEEVLGHIPAAVVVVDAASRQIVYANPRARQMTAQLGRSIPPDLTEDWKIFHPGGRPYDVDEWPLVRSLTTGEEVVDEEYFNLLADGGRLFVRASSAPIFGDAAAIVGGVLWYIFGNESTEPRRTRRVRAGTGRKRAKTTRARAAAQ
jgi:PAS domain-containing protein